MKTAPPPLVRSGGVRSTFGNSSSWDHGRLLLLLAQGSPRPDGEVEMLVARQSERAWAGLIEEARQQQVLPLVCRNLERLNFVNVPQVVREALTRAYRKNTLRNFALARELAAVLRALDRAGVPVIPLKGLPLAESLYGSIAMRVCADIDLLVPRALRPTALEVLSDCGYHPAIQSPFLQRLTFRHDIEYALVRLDATVDHVVELHWGLFTGSATEIEGMRHLWDTAIATQFLGAPCWSLTPEWEVLFLSAHAARHEWQGLKWLVDIHEICERGEVDWTIVRGLADQLHWTALVQISLGVVHRLFETTLPSAFPDPRLPAWLQILPLRRRSRGPGAVLFQLRLLDGLAHKLRYVGRACLVPTVEEERWRPLPAALSVLYYALRPTRLLLKWGGWLRVDGPEAGA